MSIIIEYNPNLGNGTGAFITPKNDILLTHGDHEPFAYKYCTGIDVNNPNTSSEPFVNSKTFLNGSSVLPSSTDICRFTFINKSRFLFSFP